MLDGGGFGSWRQAIERVGGVEKLARARLPERALFCESSSLSLLRIAKPERVYFVWIGAASQLERLP